MAVSVVDLRCVFGRSLVVFDESTLLFSSVSWTQGVLYCVGPIDPGCGLWQHHNNISVFISV